jgi:MFS family permease
MHQWFVVAHVLGAFLFVAAHGVSMGATLMLRGEHERGRVATLLQLSQSGIGIMYVGLALLLGGGIAAGFSGNHWGELWLWVAIGVLLVVAVAMYAMGSTFYMRLRNGLLIPAADGKVRESKDPPLSDAEVDAMLDSSRPYVLALIGGVGLVVIVWLMVAKPF